MLRRFRTYTEWAVNLATNSDKSFELAGEMYTNFCHPYNTTWKNERAAEIPICSKLLQAYKKCNVLEVGNVLSHYFGCNHTIVDKYEKGKGIINLDILSYCPPKQFDLILTISTLEHIGWDESSDDQTKHPDKILRALERLQSMLKTGGQLLASFPIGYNSFLDHFVDTKQLPFKHTYFLKRVSKDNRYKEVPYEEIAGAKSGSPFLRQMRLP